MGKGNDTLTPKQELFCREFLVDLNATQAAIRAGYSKRTARSTASENLTKPDISRRLRELMNERATRVDLTADRVLLELKRLALFDIRKAVEWGGGEVRMIPSNVIDDDTAAAIKKVKAKMTRIESEDGPPIESTEIELQMTNKETALRMAMEHLGLLNNAPEDAGRKLTHLPIDLSGTDTADDATGEDRS